ncbi:hypothetical protein SDC9_201314 [bioreactor metagenome]|uniref:Uncharacterized protein n=1 Tax=bioreactor metagenome TaxID=1076179 RepID=A0A645IRT2_9ZZZZ
MENDASALGKHQKYINDGHSNVKHDFEYKLFHHVNYLSEILCEDNIGKD